jgi:peptidoglycan endopeptidase LytE
MVLMALLIQGCRKNDTGQEEAANTNNPPPELPTNPPESNPPPMAAPPTAATPTPPPMAAPPAVAPPVAEGQDYTVVKGDTFATIAKKSGVSVKAMETANPGVDPKKLQIGQKLHVPAPTSATTAGAPMAAPGAPEMASAGGGQTYKVKSGDTLTGIAKQFHTSVKAIESANNLTTTSIKVGQVLKIPVTAASAPAPEPAPAPETAAPPATLPQATPTNH